MSDAAKHANTNKHVVSSTAKDSYIDTSKKSKRASSESHENISNVETSSKN